MRPLFIGCHLEHQVAEQKRPGSNYSSVIITATTKFDGLVAAFNWDNFLQSIQPSDIYTAFVAVLQSFYKASRKEVCFKQRSDKPWLNVTIMTAIKDKEALWVRSRRAPNNSELKTKFCCARNKVNAMIRSTKLLITMNRCFSSISPMQGNMKMGR